MDPGKVFLRPGDASVVDLSGFYSYNKSDTITDQDAQRFSAKLYADISLSYPDKTPQNPGEDNEFQVEQLGPSEWRYNVNLLHLTSTWPLSATTKLILNQSFEKWIILEVSLLEANAIYGPIHHVRAITL